MGDVPILPQVEPEPTVAERAEVIVERVNAAIISAVPGVPPRRAALFLIIGAALALSLPVAGIVALLVLALTDQVV